MHSRVKFGFAVGVLITAVSIPTVQAGDGASNARHRGVRGEFNLQAMMHTSTAQFPVLPGVRPWNGTSRTRSAFAYRSIPCTGNAPVNNISSNLPSYNAKVRGSRVPSSTRLRPFRFRVQRTRRGNEMVGRITLVVCQLRPGPTPDPDPVSDARKPGIRIAFRAKFRRENVEDLRFDGRFRIRGGTQRYRDLKGSGRIAGYLFCLGPARCAERGRRYLDGQISLQGSYADPTPALSSG